MASLCCVGPMRPPFCSIGRRRMPFLLSRSHPKSSSLNPSFMNWSSTFRRAAARAQSFDVVPPPIDHDPLEPMMATGAKISEDGTIETFENDDLALVAFNEGAVVVDLTHFGRIRVTGEDRIQFLHNQSTANFECLQTGQGCDTVFVTPTARTIDIAHAWIMRNAVTLLVSPKTCKSIIEMLNSYGNESAVPTVSVHIFSDKVEIHDITSQTSFFSLVGPKSNRIMEDLNLGDLVGQPYGTHRHYSVNAMPITVGVGSAVSEDGYSFLLSPATAGSVWKKLTSLGALPMGTKGWERLRVFQGRPAPGQELTNEYNVLEAGLWRAISLNKGCYKGQETISRLITYDGVKQRLWGIHLSAPAEPGTVITINEKKVGKLTSYAKGIGDSDYFGLGYIKKQAGMVGDDVYVGDSKGKIVEVPFLDHHLK